MNNTELFQIGDVARLFHISVGSLSYYEQAGLLKPQYVDPDTGYRYYSSEQFEVLNTIRYLRAIDMPLAEIADFLQNKDVDIIKEKLTRQKEIVLQKQQELKKIERKIEGHFLNHNCIRAYVNVVNILVSVAEKRHNNKASVLGNAGPLYNKMNPGGLILSLFDSVIFPAGQLSVNAAFTPYRNVVVASTGSLGT